MATLDTIARPPSTRVWVSPNASCVASSATPMSTSKTTVLTLVGCLRSIQEGSVKLLGTELDEADDETLMCMRHRIGFKFHAHNLHKSLTATQNVQMGLQIHGRQANRNWREAGRHMLGLIGLVDRADFMPDQLSGGQKQSVAVARAMVGNPEVVFADEPTAALDKESGHSVVSLLRRLADERQTTVFMVTHDHCVLDYADRIIKMEDGRVVEETSSIGSRTLHPKPALSRYNTGL